MKSQVVYGLLRPSKLSIGEMRASLFAYRVASCSVCGTVQNGIAQEPVFKLSRREFNHHQSLSRGHRYFHTRREIARQFAGIEESKFYL